MSLSGMSIGKGREMTKYFPFRNKAKKYSKPNICSRTRVLGVLNFLLSFCFFYCLMLFVYFNRYQAKPERTLAGEVAFQPWIYLGSVASFFVLHQIFCRIRKLWGIILADMCVIVCSVLLIPISGDRYLLGIMLALYVFVDFVRLGKLEKKSDLEMEDHFVGKSNAYWGVGILLLLTGHFLTADHKSGLPMSSMQCMFWMLGVYFIYLVLYYFWKYEHMFDMHINKRKMVSQVAYGQMKKVIGFVIFVAAAGTSLLFLLAGMLTKVFEPYLDMLAKVLLGLAALAGISINDSAYGSLFNSQGGDLPKLLEGQRQNGAIRHQAPTSDSLRFFTTGLLLVLLLLAVFAVAYMIFRKLATTAIPHKEDEDEILVVDSGRERLQKGNGVLWRRRAEQTANEQVRRTYRKMVVSQNRASKIRGLGRLTSGEIEEAVPKDGQAEEWMKEVTIVYDKARYSLKDVSMEDAGRVKTLCQQMRRRLN